VFFQPREPKDRRQTYGSYVAVALPEPTQPGQALTLEFRYAGKRVIRKVGNGNYFCESFGWYPAIANSFAARSDFEINFSSPKRYTLVATGSKVNETADGDWRITSWKSDIPLAVAGFAFGDYAVQTEKAGDVEIQVYANKEPDDFMRSIEHVVSGDLPGQNTFGMPAMGSLSPSVLRKQMATEAANTIRVFEKYFGPYPYKHLAVTNIPFAYGQGWPGLLYLSALSFLDSTQRNALGISGPGQVFLTDFFRGHESSHQWWGHRVGWKSYHDQWLSEGFAEFSGNLYVQFRQNPKEYLERVRLAKRNLRGLRDLRNRPYESVGPIWMGERLSTPDSPGAYNLLVYEKGGYVLHMLRMMMYDYRGSEPEARFMAMMRDFCEIYNNKPASTEDFKAVAEKHMTPAMDLDGNRHLDWLFNQYVYGTGIPQYEFHYTVEPAEGNKWKVSGNVAQRGVPQGWKDAIPIYMHANNRTMRLGFVTAQGENTPFDFLLPMQPGQLTINDNEDLLAEVKQ
ncbi:MAG TPA: M1 family aminopeptidase, partial [Candidatus Acidoferrales bacterium]|nr:M1 family aminopeptidase [Candidatus Acidoferrales bacterium]